MKRLLCLFLVILFTVGLAGCSATDIFSSNSSEVYKFGSIWEHKGIVYSGFEGGDAVHVGDAGENTKFCIIDDYIYYYPIIFGHCIADTYYNDIVRIWRTDLNGNNKVCVAEFGLYNSIHGTSTYISDPYIIDNTMYLSVNEFDSSYNSSGWRTWVHNMDNAVTEVGEGGIAYLKGQISEFPNESNANIMIGANEECLFYKPNDYLQDDPPYYTGIVVYNIKNNAFSTIDTDYTVNEIFAEKDRIYYNVSSDGFACYRCDLQTGENVKIGDYMIHYINDNLAYYNTDDSGIFSLNLSTMETKQVFDKKNSCVILETEDCFYFSKFEPSFYGDTHFQYNKKTGAEKIVARFEYPN